MDIQILSESSIEQYTSPTQRVKQRVITYLAEGLAPRGIFVNADQLPDAVYQAKNPGKPVPADVQAQGDAVRRRIIEAEIAKMGQVVKPRSI